MVWSHGQPSERPGGGGIVNCFVHVVPPSVECQRGAFCVLEVHDPEKLVTTIWLGFAGLSATLGSVPPVVSVLAKFGVVLLTAGSTTTGLVTPEGANA
jgi:hypothetical protein